MIYKTNAIESVNSGLRKITNNKRIFPNDESVFTSFYLTLNYMTEEWTMPIQNWGEALSHFMIKFEGRI
jgi:transposase-like protein